MERLPSYNALKHYFPISEAESDFIESSRQMIRHILHGTDQRLLLIVGPCSIHQTDSALAYAQNLKCLADSVSDRLFLVMRVYCEKPRTIDGWKGFLYDPFLDGSHRIQMGIEYTRLLLKELAKMGVPAATEFLDPMTAYYYDDLISWGSIGARTTSSQIHRQLASGLTMPIGMKNGIAGNISAAIDGMLAASHPHTFLGVNDDGIKSILRTEGNKNLHLVLRGGESGPNFDAESIETTIKKLEQSNLQSSLIVDCSHHNSNKNAFQQPAVFQSVMKQILDGNKKIRGMMIESHLRGGNQPLLLDGGKLEYGVSITDPCLDWDTTRELIEWGAMALGKEHSQEERLSFETLLTN